MRNSKIGVQNFHRNVIIQMGFITLTGHLGHRELKMNPEKMHPTRHKLVCISKECTISWITLQMQGKKIIDRLWEGNLLTIVKLLVSLIMNHCSSSWPNYSAYSELNKKLGKIYTKSRTSIVEYTSILDVQNQGDFFS